MINTPVPVTIKAQEVAAIHLQIPGAAMRTEFPKALDELSRTLEQQGIKPVGPVFTHHFRRPTDTFDFLACIPVTRPIVPAGRVQPVSMPALPVLRTTHHGDYAGLPHAWGDFITALQPQAPTMRGDFLETYTIGPHQAVSPAEWRTDLSIILTAHEGQTA